MPDATCLMPHATRRMPLWPLLKCRQRRALAYNEFIICWCLLFGARATNFKILIVVRRTWHTWTKNMPHTERERERDGYVCGIFGFAFNLVFDIIFVLRCVCWQTFLFFSFLFFLLPTFFEWGKQQMRQSSGGPVGQRSVATTTRNQRKFSGKVNKFSFSLLSLTAAQSLPHASCHMPHAPCRLLPFRATKCLKSLAAFIASPPKTKWPKENWPINNIKKRTKWWTSNTLEKQSLGYANVLFL